MDNATRWKLSDLKQLVECSTAADGPAIEMIRQIVKITEEEENINFILGKVIVENDLLDDDDDSNE